MQHKGQAMHTTIAKKILNCVNYITNYKIREFLSYNHIATLSIKLEIRNCLFNFLAIIKDCNGLSFKVLNSKYTFVNLKRKITYFLLMKLIKFIQYPRNNHKLKQNAMRTAIVSHCIKQSFAITVTSN